MADSLFRVISTAKQRAYREYLRTEHWLDLRQQALLRDDFQCTQCPSVERLQVHHLIYRTRWEDGILEDVKTLCRDCHRKEHGFSVWIEREFDVVLSKLNHQLNTCNAHAKLPSDEQVAVAAKLAECADDENEVEAILRNIAGMRIILTRSDSWRSWLSKDNNLRFKLWPWSRNKRIRLKLEKAE